MGSLMPKSSCKATRQPESENQFAGKNELLANTTIASKTKFKPRPREKLGGSTSKMIPNNETTTPSLHFSVAPPRKQARTGRIGTKMFLHHRPGSSVKLGWILDRDGDMEDGDGVLVWE